MSYAGEEQSVSRRGVHSSLGLREWRDVDAAIAFALRSGAKRVVLFGWSMGATAALLSGERSINRDSIAAFVFIDPATNWRSIVRSAARQAHAPAILAWLACAILAAPGLFRLTGSPVRLDFDELDWTRRWRVVAPSLVIHSHGDRLVPFELSTRFVSAQQPNVRLVVFDDVPHCAEYNADAARFDKTIIDWLGCYVANDPS
ncbi:alpha/beta hydrolase family protein [Humibacter albus]|uniref:alpha/beta hydrolase family protein n=1 Tax=Humibacter albus TaxID=427754 RepID=UPI001469BB8F|nr:alpha/beta fold hydrolase [Humibacter albus]